MSTVKTRVPFAVGPPLPLVIAGMMAGVAGTAVGIAGVQAAVVLLAAASALVMGGLVVRRRAELRSRSSAPLATWVAGLGTVSIVWTAVSVGETAVSVGDALFLVAALLFAGAAIQGPSLHRAVPPWLVVPAILFLFAACLVELFPYSPHSVPAKSDVGAVQPMGTADTNLTGLLKLEAATFLIPLVVLLATTRSRVAPMRGLVLFAKLWLISATVSALVAALDTLDITAVEAVLPGEVLQGQRISGLTTHPNRLGLMSAMSLPIALYFLAEARRVRRGLYAAILGMLSFAIVVSGSRAALLAGALGVVYLLAVSPSIRRTITPLALSIGVMGLASASVVSSDMSATGLARLEPGSASAVRSDARREVRYWEAVRQIEDRPFTGVGFGSIEGAHSIYLQLLQSGGVIAIFAFVLFVSGAVRTGLRLGRRAARSERRGLALALLGSIGAFLVAGVASNDVAGRGLYVPVGLIAALAMIERRERVTPQIPGEIQRA